MATVSTQTAAPVPSAPVDSPPASGPVRSLLWRVLLPAIAIASGALLWLDFEPEVVGVLGLVMMLTLMAMKVPLGVAMGIPGILGTWSIVGWHAAEGSLRRLPLESAANWSLTVLPMFILMGLLLWRSGLTEHLYSVARVWVGWLPGGLAIGTNLAGAGFAALSGSTMGSIFPLSRAGMPEMLKAGYDRRLALGSIAAAGTLAHLIPPSLFLLIYAGVASVPVGPQLMAGLIPGVLLALLYCITIVVLSLLKPALVGGRRAGQHRYSMGERVRSLGKIWDAPLLIVVVVAGIYGGFFTVTEAGAVGAAGALVICLIRRRGKNPLRAITQAATETVSTVGAMFFLLVGAYLLSRMMSVTGLASWFAEMVIDLEMSRVAFLITMVVVYIILGMFMDSLAMMLLTVPIILPLFATLGISEIWFGVFLVVFMELAVLTPPVGVLSYILHNIVQDREVNLGQRISIGAVFQGVLCVIPVALLLVGLMIAFPEIVTWLPDSMPTAGG
ncbi:TRAP transporter large permease [Georgenia sp. AZ-5]|uniref:TRAP transporter large permease n=1 Tax=Georgenia sp. AZ-5 TaxID=3367526 RepID=UPI0037542C58